MHTWPAPHVPIVPGRGEVARLVDSASGAFVVSADGAVATMYVCGITPYDATHLGHAATFIAFDLLHRSWLDAGMEVRYASNVTDVDEPLLERATATGVDWQVLAKTQTALFAEDMTALGVLPPHMYLGAVEAIPLVVDAVTRLMETGHAYRVPLEASAGGADPSLGDVYADLSGGSATGSDGAIAPRFDVLAGAGLSRDEALAVFAECGGDPDRPGKRDPLDPALWRRERTGEPSWDGGVLGSGRPGWHIECTVIASHALGSQFDVQGGGRDLSFPHHAMSTAHARAIGERGARVQMHTGMVRYRGEKMSKSLGNLVLVSRLRADGVDPMAIRLAVLAHHYRQDWEWDDAVLTDAQRRLVRWRDAVSATGGPDPQSTMDVMRAAIAHDLDTPAALRAVDTWVDAALTVGGDVIGAQGVMCRAMDALLGIRI